MAELHVSKKTIRQLFGNMQGKKFIIPDFQRPYMWDEERCETLWNDIKEFHEDELRKFKDAKADFDYFAQKGLNYFLGTIVSYSGEQGNDENDEKDAENPKIIDGQQRISSFFLLLRALYSTLEEDSSVNKEDKDDVQKELVSCLWDTTGTGGSGKKPNLSKTHIKSLVATTTEDNGVLDNILQTGKADDKAEDNYSVNYRFFKKVCSEFVKGNPSEWYYLCVTILDKCIILPIECNTSETALTIFSTLNDRGMPLADSDIFKAKIYRMFDMERKGEFTEIWKELTITCDKCNGNLSIDDVFRYYTHVLRAQEDDKTKEVALRKFYTSAESKYNLNNMYSIDEFMREIMIIAEFWQDISLMNPNEQPKREEYKISLEAHKYLHCLKSYPNDIWKYATTVFLMRNKGDSSFDKKFERFLKKITAFLFAKFIVSPGRDAIKDDIYGACICIWEEFDFNINSDLPKVETVEQNILETKSRFSKSILLLYAYLDPDQTQLIPDKYQVEHIYPRKPKQSNKAQEPCLERLGNKVIIDKKTNIQISNEYFGDKKEKYQKSAIACVRELARYPGNYWKDEEIDKRESEIKKRVMAFFKEEFEQFSS